MHDVGHCGEHPLARLASCMHACMRAGAQARVHPRRCAWMHLCTHMCSCASMCARVHACALTGSPRAAPPTPSRERHPRGSRTACGVNVCMRCQGVHCTPVGEEVVQPAAQGWCGPGLAWARAGGLSGRLAPPTAGWHAFAHACVCARVHMRVHMCCIHVHVHAYRSASSAADASIAPTAGWRSSRLRMKVRRERRWH